MHAYGLMCKLSCACIINAVPEVAYFYSAEHHVQLAAAAGDADLMDADTQPIAAAAEPEPIKVAAAEGMCPPGMICIGNTS